MVVISKLYRPFPLIQFTIANRVFAPQRTLTVHRLQKRLNKYVKTNGNCKSETLPHPELSEPGMTTDLYLKSVL